MGTLSLTDPVNGTTADATLIATNNAAIKTTVNGGIDNSNISATAAIAVSKLADPGAGKVIGSNLGAAAVFPPGYEIVSAQVTTDTTIATATYTDLLTFSAGTFEATKYYFEMIIPVLRNTASGNSTLFELLEGSTVVGNPIQFDSVAGGGNGASAVARLSFTPTAASHTYKVQWSCSAGTSTIRTTSLAPAEFRIVKA